MVKFRIEITSLIIMGFGMKKMNVVITIMIMKTTFVLTQKLSYKHEKVKFYIKSV